MSNAVSTTGIKVKRALLATPTVFTDIGELVSVTPPGFSRTPIPTTTHNDGAESKILGILMQKDPEFRINWVGSDTTHADLLDDIMDDVKNQWQIAMPSGITMTGPARVQRFEPVEAPVNAAQQADCALSWAGPIVVVTP